MKKSIFTLSLLVIVICNNYAQECEYIDDATGRVLGSTSAPLCTGTFTYCSKNGYSHFPNTTYRTLNLYINIIYDIVPSYDPYYNNNNGACAS